MYCMQSRRLLLDDKVRWFCVVNCLNYQSTALSSVYHVVAVGVQETLFPRSRTCVF